MRTLPLLAFLAFTLISLPVLAQKPAEKSKIEAAVKPKVVAQVRDKFTKGSGGTKVLRASVTKITLTEAVSGWSNRYRTEGIVEINMSSSSPQPKQHRAFEAITELSASGAVVVLDVTIKM